jgi:archaemetzincin
MTPGNTSGICVGVIPFGEETRLAAKVIAAHVEGFMRLPCRTLDPMARPDYAFDPQRLQYDAGRIIERLEARPPGDCPKVVGVLSVDLFIPVFSHVFGEARFGGNAAVVSLHRLGLPEDGRHPDPPRVLERAAKVALHELGHLLSLTHCSDPACLMHFCGDLAGLDALSLLFCRYCHRFMASSATASQTGETGRV